MESVSLENWFFIDLAKVVFDQITTLTISDFQMNTALQQQRLEVEQLRREAAMKRIPVSQAVEDIKVKKKKLVKSVTFNMILILSP